MSQFVNTNDYLTGRKQMPTSSEGSEVLSVRFTIYLTTADLNLGDIGAVGKLPAGHIPVDVHVDGTDMDSGAAALVFNVGLGNRALQDAAGNPSSDPKNTLISTVAGDGGGAWGSTTAANTAFNQRLTFLLNNINAVTPSDTDRDIVAKVATAPTTPVAGTLGVTLFYRAA